MNQNLVFEGPTKSLSAPFQRFFICTTRPVAPNEIPHSRPSQIFHKFIPY